VEVEETWLHAGDPARLVEGVSGVAREICDKGVFGDKIPSKSVVGGGGVQLRREL